MQLLRYREDRPYLLFYTLVLALDLVVYLNVEHPLVLFVWFLLGILPKASACAFNHHHQHVPTFHGAFWNRVIEFMFALQTGITSQAWVLHHSLGHHVTYLDQTKDQSRWRRDDGSVMGEMEYSFNVTLTAYPRAWQVGARYPRARRTFLWMGLASLALVVALVAYRPVPGFFIFVLAPAFSLWGTAWATYAHHVTRDTSSHFVASNNMVHRVYNIVTANLGYHTAHHSMPGVHWSRLPELHAKIAHKIPADAYVAPGWPWRWFGDAATAAAFAAPELPEPEVEKHSVMNGDDSHLAVPPPAPIAPSSVAAAAE